MDIALALIVHPRLPHVLMARRKKDTHLASFWEFPGGKVEANETSLQCVVREAREETGLLVTPIDQWPSVTYDYEDRSVTLLPFLCLAASDDAQPLGSDKVRWANVADLKDYSFPPANESILQQLKTSLPRTLRFASTDDEIAACLPVVEVLRPHFAGCKTEDFIAQVRRQQAEGYYFAYLAAGGNVCSVAGFRIREMLSWGKALYIDDLVTATQARGQGYGGSLLDQVIAYARLNDCDSVHLDSGYAREAAHRLYLNHGFHLASHHFSQQLKQP